MNDLIKCLCLCHSTKEKQLGNICSLSRNCAKLMLTCRLCSRTSNNLEIKKVQLVNNTIKRNFFIKEAKNKICGSIATNMLKLIIKCIWSFRKKQELRLKSSCASMANLTMKGLHFSTFKILRQRPMAHYLSQLQLCELS